MALTSRDMQQAEMVRMMVLPLMEMQSQVMEE